MNLYVLFPGQFRRAVAAILVFNLIGLTVFGGVAQAGLISTFELQQVEQLHYDRQQVLQLLEREEVQRSLIALGVTPELAKERVNNLTVDELAQLHANIDELPAGGDILGVLLIIFIVFVITDVIGATDIFPFINSVNN